MNRLPIILILLFSCGVAWGETCSYQNCDGESVDKVWAYSMPSGERVPIYTCMKCKMEDEERELKQSEDPLTRKTFLLEYKAAELEKEIELLKARITELEMNEQFNKGKYNWMYYGVDRKPDK